jgi:SAM-dependent methyltransferase
MWNEKTPLHLKSPVYDLDGFKAGRLSLKPHEVSDLGDVTGKDLLHLQCHIGLDTLSWGRLGARVTGLDFSNASVEAARRLSQAIGVEAHFVEADVYDAVSALGRARFDIVYTGVGALCWLPDIAGWARTVRNLLRPGGQLYLFEFHPVEWILSEGDDYPTIAFDYFTDAAGYRDGGGVVYADSDTPVQANATVQWNHSLGDVVTAVVEAGLRIDSLREMDREVIQRWRVMDATEDGMFKLPADRPSLPLMYVLRASLPV